MKRIGMVLAAIIVLFGVGLMTGCDGDGDANPVPTAPVRIMLVDAPYDAVQELHVGLESVQLARRSHPRITLLHEAELPDDVDVIATGQNPLILGTVEVPVGEYTFAELQVDADAANRVRLADGSEHPLTYEAPTGEGSNLVLPFDVVAGEQKTLLFDFSAAASVREENGNWILRPQIFSQYIESDVQFGSMRGVVREVDGQRVEAPEGLILGVEMRTQGGLRPIARTQVSPDDGVFVLPKIAPDNYTIEVKLFTATWEDVVGDPLLGRVFVRVFPNAQATPQIEIDL